MTFYKPVVECRHMKLTRGIVVAGEQILDEGVGRRKFTVLSADPAVEITIGQNIVCFSHFNHMDEADLRDLRTALRAEVHGEPTRTTNKDMKQFIKALNSILGAELQDL